MRFKNIFVTEVEPGVISDQSEAFLDPFCEHRPRMYVNIHLINFIISHDEVEGEMKSSCNYWSSMTSILLNLWDSSRPR